MWLLELNFQSFGVQNLRVELWVICSKGSECNVGNLGFIPGQGDPLEKGMATHCYILAWRIPWTEEPGGPQSMGHRHN